VQPVEAQPTANAPASPEAQLPTAVASTSEQ
jgi:hypothetical protein